MINLTKIQTAFLHLVGFYPSTDPQIIIPQPMQKTDSGLYYTDGHPLLTLENMYAVLNTEGAGFMPELVKAINNAIAEVVHRFIEEKQIMRETKSLLENRTFFDGAGRIANTLQNTHKICGFEILPLRAKGVTAKITQVGLQFNNDCDFTLYLMHSSSPYPIYQKPITYANNGGVQWEDLNWELPYNEPTLDIKGGSYYLVYRQDELGALTEAVNVSKDWSREPCGTCNIGSVETWREITKYMQISPFMVQDDGGTMQLWDIADNIYTNTNNYGLNCEVRVECDLTNIFIENKMLFARALQKQFTYDMLRTIAMNPYVKVNRNQNNVSRMDILYELDGNTQGRQSGLGYELEKIYKAINIDTKGISRACLCENNHGVRYRSI